MSNDKNTKTIQHPLFGIAVSNWIRLLLNNHGFDKQYSARVLFVTLTSIVLTPARVLFHLKYNKKIQETTIQHPPIFIIGHWRSGTTYLHELLCNDPQFCYISLWHTLLPDSFLILNPVKKFLANFLPAERPMDAITVDIDGPYEDEAGVAILSPWSFFHCLHFPKNAEEQYVKSIYQEHLSQKEKTDWKNTYLHFLKTISFVNNGKQLLSKNPPNTARIHILQEMFPNAYFIHIYRNPYKVYLSTIKMRNRVLDKLALQKGSSEEIEQSVIQNYIRVMKSFFEQEKQIPKEQYVEIRYEDLVANPLKTVKNIYSTFNLDGFEKALPAMQNYLESKADYQVNVYNITDAILDRVKKQWGFTIDRWKYKPPS